jgi:hypothetical protein
MFTFTFLVGIYSFLIFFLGITGLLYKNIIIGMSLFFIFISFYTYKSSLSHYIKRVRLPSQVFPLFLFTLLFLQIGINLIGALGPETSFDALWYHLTLPKLYLSYHKIFYIPGGLFYYSLMPKLGEMLYVSALSFGNEIFAKLIHFFFGILSCIALFHLARKKLNKTFSLIAVLIFYINLVVSWESTVAYVDLIRTFFEIMALLAWIEYMDTKKEKFFYSSAIFLGFAITTKLLAFGSLCIFLTLIIFYEKQKKSLFFIGKRTFLYVFFSLLIPLPWFIFSYITSGNPVYPFLTNTYPFPSSLSFLNPLFFLQSFWNIFTHSQDPLNPLYIMTFPLLILYSKKLYTRMPVILIYSAGGLLVWYVSPRTGGGRFILPYLPAFSIIVAFTLSFLQKGILRNFFISSVICVACVSLLYRGITNSKYIPVITDFESKDDFLTRNLHFSFGDFYDTDNYFKSHIKRTDTVLLLGFHNLYYVNFPFIDSSYVTKHDMYNYIAVQSIHVSHVPVLWQLQYENPITHVRLYALSQKP